VRQLQRIGDLEVAQDLAFERKQAVTRRVAGVIAAAILVAALLGVFGGGPLADATESSGPLSVDYERFLRFESQGELEVQPPTTGGLASVAISSDYLSQFSVGSISPTPATTSVLSDRLVYTFKLAPRGRVTFELTPEKVGKHNGTIWAGDDAHVRISQFVYP
jgi:hypothetical protein